LANEKTLLKRYDGIRFLDAEEINCIGINIGITVCRDLMET
jgi:hypothetical protein